MFGSSIAFICCAESGAFPWSEAVSAGRSCEVLFSEAGAVLGVTDCLGRKQLPGLFVLEAGSVLGVTACLGQKQMLVRE